MQGIAERLAELHTTSPLLFWVGGSVLAYSLLTNALWLLRSRVPAGVPYRRWLEELLRFIFFLGVPYLALGGWPRRPFQGLLSAEDMGIVGLWVPWTAARWLQVAGTGLMVGLVALLILFLAWILSNRGRGGFRLSFPARAWWLLLVDGLYLQVHWALYRAALALSASDLYVGVFAGLALVYVEWASNPFWRQGWRDRSEVGERWLRSALALVAAILFLLTRSLWVCLGVHWAIELVFWIVGRERVPSQPA